MRGERNIRFRRWKPKALGFRKEIRMCRFPGVRGRGFTFITVLLLVLQGACSLKTPEVKTPAPNDRKKDKSFFVEFVNEGGKTVQKSRTFQCAWAPISETGYYAGWFFAHGANIADHCNIEWRIEEHYLLGRKIDPSTDRKDWKTIISIPIRGHFKTVQDKDDKGRVKKDIVDKSDEGHWSRLPYMNLDVPGIEIHSWAYDMMGGAGHYGGVKVLAVEDEEVSEHNGKKYWAFTLSVASPFFLDELQAKIRFNFLEFTTKDESKFAATPYKQENARHLNVLHVLGKKFESEAESFYNARWDLSGGDRSIEVCTYGVPAKYKQMLTDVVEDWNDVFAAIGKPRAFWVNHVRKLNYPLDLRCPTIVWVSDKRISSRSPLGIGLINADVKNGEALWGSIVMYGGAFERYAKAYSPSDFAAAQADQNPMPVEFGIDTPFDIRSNPKYFFTDDMMARNLADDQWKKLFEQAVLQDGAVDDYGYFEGLLAMRPKTEEEEKRLLRQVYPFIKKTDAEGKPLTEAQIDTKARDFLATMRSQANPIERALQVIAYRDGKSREQVLATVNQKLSSMKRSLGLHQADGKKKIDSYLAQKPLPQRLLGPLGPTEPKGEKERVALMERNRMRPEQRAVLMRKQTQEMARRQLYPKVWDFDRTFADVAPGWRSAPVANGRRDFEDRLMSMLKRTFSHEFGHFLGSGHNFKENILPKKGTVPEKYLKFAEENVRKYRSALTTVMGYDDPSVEVNQTYEDIKPGPHDYLMMRYIYNREYTTWNGSDPDFKYVKLPNDGKIPPADPFDETYKTTYFPQCNDYQATLSLDPYCMRHDSGYNAATLVDNYFNYLDKNWIANVTNIAETSKWPAWAMYRWLWQRSFSTFAKVRHFYDYMVTKYRDELMEISLKADNLMSFYKTCAGIEENRAVADVLRRADGELTELCKVNGDALVKMRRFLEDPGSDFTEFDHTSSFIVSSVTGGDVDIDYSRMAGTWQRLGMLPLKYAALITLTSTEPYLYAFSRWLFPLFQYDNSGVDYKNLYSTFYPEQFTEAISATVNTNLRFKNSGGGSNSMGRSVLALGWFLDSLWYSNEGHRGVPTDYLENIRRQNEMRGGYVAIVLKTVKRKDDKAESDRVVGFTAQMWDFASQTMLPLGVAYVLPDAKIIFSTPDEKSFIYPISELEFYSNEGAFGFAIRMTFNEEDKSSLWTRSSKVALKDHYKAAVNSCLVGVEKNGVENGIRNYFHAGTPTFRGFHVLPDIADSGPRFKKFKDSIREEFVKYWTHKSYKDADNVPGERACENALSGIGLVVTSSVAIQGWWLPEIVNYIVH